MTKQRICATATGLPKFTRRSLISSVPAASAALVFSASETAAQQEDPILSLSRERVIARDEWIRLSDVPGNENWDWPESVSTSDRQNCAIDSMADMSPTSLEGIAALTHVFWDLEGPSFRPDHEEYDEICNRTGNKLIRAIWRAASGREGLPG